MWIKYIKDEQGIEVIRVYGQTPDISLPGTIEGCPVIGIYNYCFSEKNKTSCIEGSKLIKYGADTDGQTVQKKDLYDELQREIDTGIVTDVAGDFLEEIVIPDGIKKIGDYCFYQCRKLHTISLGPGVIEFGSDVFMNCGVLHTVIIRSSVSKKNSLRQIVTYRTQETDVWFDDAAIQFPEVHESYELIGPAHIFELNVEGQGIRARQCFEGDIFRFDLYDRVFAHAINTEDEHVLCRMAAFRLKFPLSIRDEYKSAYENYLTKHIDVLCDEMIARKDLSIISDLLEQGMLKEEQTDIVLTKLSQAGWLQGTTQMIAFINSRS